MKIERISDTTVKLTLSHIDFEKRSINVSDLQVDSPTYQQLLWDALEHAEIELGMQISAGRIRVEEAGDPGNYEITITNIPGVSTKSDAAETAEEKLPERRQIQPLRQVAAIPAPVLAQLVKSGVIPAEALGQGVETAGMPEVHIHGEPVPFPDEQGLGVVCFNDYNEMYGFFKANPSFAGIPSTLYTLEDRFYLIVRASRRVASLVARLEVRLSDYDATVLPAEVFLPMLEEYGSVMFKKGAIKKVVASLGA
ncbi:MAG: adaptor protein MecA [Clostridia bacterium]|nr:adaptor protein MecA [Clostridia bacterium]